MTARPASPSTGTAETRAADRGRTLRSAHTACKDDCLAVDLDVLLGLHVLGDDAGHGAGLVAHELHAGVAVEEVGVLVGGLGGLTAVEHGVGVVEAHGGAVELEGAHLGLDVGALVVGGLEHEAGLVSRGLAVGLGLPPVHRLAALGVLHDEAGVCGVGAVKHPVVEELHHVVARAAAIGLGELGVDVAAVVAGGAEGVLGLLLEGDHGVAFLGKLHGRGAASVAQAHDAHVGLVGLGDEVVRDGLGLHAPRGAGVHVACNLGVGGLVGLGGRAGNAECAGGHAGHACALDEVTAGDAFHVRCPFPVRAAFLRPVSSRRANRAG